MNPIGFLLFGPKLVQNSEKINFGTKVLRDYTPYRTISEIVDLSCITSFQFLGNQNAASLLKDRRIEL